MLDIEEAIDAVIIILSEELRDLVKKKGKKRRKCRNWIMRREIHGGSNSVVREIANEDPKEYRRHLRLCGKI